MAHENQPQRIPLHVRYPDTPFRATTMARAALLIRVATGLDQWAERDRHTGQSRPD